MTKTTLTALGAALIALGQALQSEEGDTPAPAEATTTSRRGRGPAKQPENPPADEKKELIDAATETKLRALFNPLLGIGKGTKVKETLLKFGGANLITQLPAADEPAFVAEINKLLTEFAADITTASI